ncbi:MAG TPA: permease [Epulopiscium sp.]|nr:permease [Candidatus Epulonipiscium sp.]
MSKVKSAISNNKFLFSVMVLYLALALFMPGKALQSIGNSLYYVKEMLMIMPVILLLTALITAWVPKDAIEKNLGRNSGFKGSIFSFLLGSFSAGPIYAAFPVCKALLSKGASISNIVILLSTWAVLKVPMLINESKFLGPKFMIVRWILTTTSIFLMGSITSKFVKKEDLPADELKEESEQKIIRISQEYCIGCGLCTKISPKHFKMNSKKAKVLSQDIDPGEMDLITEAMEKCPPKIITFN